MTFKRLVPTITLVPLLAVMQARADYFDTGLTELHQDIPYKSTVFSARHWGDAFESWYRTGDGYTIVRVYDEGKTLDCTPNFGVGIQLV